MAFYRLTHLVCLTVLVAGLLPVAQRPLLAQSAPAARWTFDDGTAADSSGGGFAGTLQGNAAPAHGLVGAGALRLAGKGSFVDVPRPVVDTSRSYTVMAWVKLNTVDGFQTFASIDGDQVSGFFLQLRGDTGSFALTAPLSDRVGDGAIASGYDTATPNVWYHIAGVHDAAAHTVQLFVDGAPQQSAAFDSPWRAAGHTAIGRAKWAGAAVDWTKADIDDVRFYDSALSAAEIQAIAKANLPPGSVVATSAPAPPTLRIDASPAAKPLRPLLYGLMTEEINYSYDGGLYAELIRNRAFKDDPQLAAHWSLVGAGADGSIALDTSQPLDGALDTSLRVDARGASAGKRVGVANDGYWGVPVTPNTRYNVSFYARAAPGFAGPLDLDMESGDGKSILARSVVPRISGEWHRYEATLTTGSVTPSASNRFVIATEHPGTVWLDLVSVMPPTFHGRPNGNRIDLMEKLAAMKPAFLRLPGGNYLEGDTIETRFEWKKTVGPLEKRAGHPGPWGYRSTDGMGLLEFLEWCEDLHMQPVLAVYAGYSLRGAHVEPGPALQPFVQDALDEIEYATGSTGTKWGVARAADGHRAPFSLRYVEIGNEDWFDRSGSYGGRYAQFYDAIKARFPALQLIATTGVTTRTPDVIDEHFYRSPRAFENDARRYDKYDRNGPKIFVGEWASQEGKPTPDMNSALGDAAWMTGMERNSDIVALESYAPLFVNVNPRGAQWGTNLIGYDGLTSYGSPSYYAQAMFGNATGDRVLPSALAGGRGLFASVTRDSTSGALFLKMVNTSADAQTVAVSIAGVHHIAPTGTSTVLSASGLNETNTLADPTHIVPKSRKATGLSAAFSAVLAPYSITVLQMTAR